MSACASWEPSPRARPRSPPRWRSATEHCDTETFVTAIFHEVYLGERNAELEAMVEPERYALYLLCDLDTPFHRDRLGLRREDARRAMHERYLEHLRASAVRWVEVRGAHEERMRTAVAAIDALF